MGFATSWFDNTGRTPPTANACVTLLSPRSPLIQQKHAQHAQHAQRACAAEERQGHGSLQYQCGQGGPHDTAFEVGRGRPATVPELVRYQAGAASKWPSPRKLAIPCFRIGLWEAVRGRTRTVVSVVRRHLIGRSRKSRPARGDGGSR